VGVGDGSSLSRILEELASLGYAFRAQGIDPEAPEGLTCDPAITFATRRAPIENCDFALPFDVINVRQSAYYFSDLAGVFRKLTQALSPGGVLIVTHWAEGCFLFKLHDQIARELGQAPEQLGVTDLARHIADGGVLTPQVSIVTDTIDLNAVLADPTLLDATLKIAARKLPISELSESGKARLVKAISEECPKQAARVNGVITLTRPQILPRKFP
jgi:SAM-dependent methyltransferase